MPKSSKTKKVSTAAKSSDSATKTVKKKKSISARIVKKKPYIEFVTAFLSIPVLITVMLLNFNSLKNLNGKATPTPGVNSSQSGFFTAPLGTTKPSLNSGADPAKPCTKSLGPVSISTPNENDTVTENPVSINIDYDDSTYCGASWSYRINGGDWSGYDNRSVALYNLPQGPVSFELRVRSIVSSEQKTLTRNFTYKGQGVVLIPTSQTGSSSAK